MSSSPRQSLAAPLLGSSASPPSPPANVWRDELTNRVVNESVRDVYVTMAAKENERIGRERAQSLPKERSDDDLLDPSLAASQIATPGGFRRQFIDAQADGSSGAGGAGAAGAAGRSSRRGAGRGGHPSLMALLSQAMQYSMIWDALGDDEELVRDEEFEEEKQLEEATSPSFPRLLMTPFHRGRAAMRRGSRLFEASGGGGGGGPSGGGNGGPVDGKTGRSNSRADQLSPEDRKHLAGNAKTVFTIFKAFVGTAVLFLPRGFYNAGLVAGVGILTVSGLVTLFAMLLLLQATKVCVENGVRVYGYGDVGAYAAGRTGKLLVQISIIASQLGFACVYFVFIAHTVRDLRAGFGLAPAAAHVDHHHQHRPPLSIIISPAPAPSPAPARALTDLLSAATPAPALFLAPVPAPVPAPAPAPALFPSPSPVPVPMVPAPSPMLPPDPASDTAAATVNALTYMAACLPIFIPMVMVRHLKYFAIMFLVADAFIIGSLLYMYGANIFELATKNSAGGASGGAGGGAGGGGGGGGGGRGGGGEDWTCRMAPDAPGSTIDTMTACLWLNPQGFLMFTGTAVYTFEGVAMVIPIRNSMLHPEALPRLLTKCVLVVMAILISFGALGLATFGRNTKSIVIGNIKGKAPAVAVQILYLLVAILSFPMITWTPIKITERWFGWTDRQSGAKWRKNAWRIFMVLVCLAISVAGSTELDNFVAIIGGVCCVPLALIFPPLFHTLILRKHGQLGRCSRIGNATLITAGVGVGILSSCMAIIGWAS